MSPEAYLLLSALAGGGGYGAVRMLRDFNSQLDEKAKPKHLNVDKLQLTNPMAQQQPEGAIKTAAPGMADDTQHILPDWATLPAIVAGLGGGYGLAQKLYEAHKVKKLQQEVDAAHKQYSDTLALAGGQSKIAADTPLLNDLCEKLAALWDDEFEKRAGIEDWLGGDQFAIEGPQHGLKLHEADGVLPNTSGGILGKDALKYALAVGGSLAALRYLSQRQSDKNEDEAKKKYTVPSTYSMG